MLWISKGAFRFGPGQCEPAVCVCVCVCVCASALVSGRSMLFGGAWCRLHRPFCVSRAGRAANKLIHFRFQIWGHSCFSLTAR